MSNKKTIQEALAEVQFRVNEERRMRVARMAEEAGLLDEVKVSMPKGSAGAAGSALTKTVPKTGFKPPKAPTSDQPYPVEAPGPMLKPIKPDAQPAFNTPKPVPGTGPQPSTVVQRNSVPGAPTSGARPGPSTMSSQGKPGASQPAFNTPKPVPGTGPQPGLSVKPPAKTGMSNVERAAVATGIGAGAIGIAGMQNQGSSSAPEAPKPKPEVSATSVSTNKGDSTSYGPGNKFKGTIKDFQSKNTGSTVGQALNAIQGKTAITGGKNDSSVIASQRDKESHKGPVLPVYTPKAGTVMNKGEKPGKVDNRNTEPGFSGNSGAELTGALSKKSSPTESPTPAAAKPPETTKRASYDAMGNATGDEERESGGKGKSKAKRVAESALINAFFALQNTSAGNIFEAAKKLKGNQGKLDKNHNGELDKEDFKIMGNMEEAIDESLRLVKTHEGKSKNGDKKTAKVYKDHEWNEYRVRHFTNGKHHTDADYHTDDMADAHDTAKNFLKENYEINERNKENKFKKDLYVAKRGADDVHGDTGITPKTYIRANVDDDSRKSTLKSYKRAGRENMKEAEEIDEAHDMDAGELRQHLASKYGHYEHGHLIRPETRKAYMYHVNRLAKMISMHPDKVRKQVKKDYVDMDHMQNEEVGFSNIEIEHIMSILEVQAPRRTDTALRGDKVRDGIPTANLTDETKRK
jgi:hypothetical protein